MNGDVGQTAFSFFTAWISLTRAAIIALSRAGYAASVKKVPSPGFVKIQLPITFGQSRLLQNTTIAILDKN
jgi:hypothetical protein